MCREAPTKLLSHWLSHAVIAQALTSFQTFAHRLDPLDRLREAARDHERPDGAVFEAGIPSHRSANCGAIFAADVRQGDTVPAASRRVANRLSVQAFSPQWGGPLAPSPNGVRHGQTDYF